MKSAKPVFPIKFFNCYHANMTQQQWSFLTFSSNSWWHIRFRQSNRTTTICICESCETQLSPPLVFDNPIVELGTPVLKFVNMLWSSYMAPFSRCNRRTFAELIDDDVFFILRFLVRACHFLWSMAKNRRRESHKIREIKNAPPYPHLSKTKCVTNRIFLKINDVR